MRWKITGADRETGQERGLLIEASTKENAELIAVETGLLISRVAASIEPAPQYPGLLACGHAMRVVGVLCYVGTLFTFLAVAGMNSKTKADGGTPETMNFLIPVAVLFYGIICHGIGEACLAIRDMARNSWA